MELVYYYNVHVHVHASDLLCASVRERPTPKLRALATLYPDYCAYTNERVQRTINVRKYLM